MWEKGPYLQSITGDRDCKEIIEYILDKQVKMRMRNKTEVERQVRQYSMLLREHNREQVRPTYKNK